MIENKYIDIDDTQIYYYDGYFEKLMNEGHTYKDLITMTHYVVKSVVSRKFFDEDGNKVENKFGYFKGAIENCIAKLNNEVEIDPETGWFKDAEEEEYDYDLDI